MRRLAILALPLCLAVAACSQNDPVQTAPVGTSVQKNEYLDLLARARSGDASAAFAIAERYAEPQKFPEWSGLKPDPYEAAIWCDMIQIKSPGSYKQQCDTYIKTLPKNLAQAAATAAQAKLQSPGGMSGH